MYISGEAVKALANAVQSLEDAQLSDDAPLFAGLGDDGRVIVPILAGDDEEPDRPMTVGDLKAILAPFMAWF
jgi:hypothetical protein